MKTKKKGIKRMKLKGGGEAKANAEAGRLRQRVSQSQERPNSKFITKPAQTFARSASVERPRPPNDDVDKKILGILQKYKNINIGLTTEDLTSEEKKIIEKSIKILNNKLTSFTFPQLKQGQGQGQGEGQGVHL